MISRDEVTNIITNILGNDLLAKAAEVDQVPNGVQIKGNDQVEKIALGVSLSPAFLEHAITHNADYLVVHHGIITSAMKNGRFDLYENRLRLIFQHNLTIAGFHYALDAHPQIGNNAQIISLLGAKNTGESYFDGWGFIGEFKNPLTLESLTQKAAELFEHDIFTVAMGPEKIKRIGVCSGGAVPREEWYEIIDKHIDCHITGEIKESTPYTAEAIQTHYLACGHYATEVFGVKALAKALHQHLDGRAEVEFIDIPSIL
jgi:dinuclear metal center YbgI/SA1388 family protein